MNWHRNIFLAFLLIAVSAALLFIPFLGNCALFDWDEVNFAECAREMLVSGDYSTVQINFLPFWEKPPLFIWMQVLCMKLFGVNEFAARLPNALCSIATLCALYFYGRKFHSSQVGYTWVLLYAATLLPHLYFRSGVIDPWFNLLILLSLCQIIDILNDPSSNSARWKGVLGGAFLGLAVLTKGPAAIVIVGLTALISAAWTNTRQALRGIPALLFTVSCLVVAGSWFLVEWLQGHGHIIEEFINYQFRLFETGDSGHDGPFYYHLIVLLLGCFPASMLFMVFYLKFRDLTPYQRLVRRIMMVLFWVVLIFFSIVKTKIVHYSSLCYFPLTYVAATGLHTRLQDVQLQRWLKVLYWLIAGVFAFALLGMAFIEHYKQALINGKWINDEFARLNLTANVHWNGTEWLLAPLFAFGSFLIYRGLLRKNRPSILSGYAVLLVFTSLGIAVIVPKVEMYSQQAAIDFYRSASRYPCYIETHGFKSYAQLFYSNRQPRDYTNIEQHNYIAEQQNNMERQGFPRISSYGFANMLWMENGVIDRPAYLVTKTPLEKDLIDKPGMKFLYRRHGYSFFVRMPDK